MKAYELSATVTPEGKVEIPNTILHLLQKEKMARIIILINEPAEIEEQMWSMFTTEQFLKGYSKTDTVYDRI